jgi:hypothetical protein
MSEPFVVAGCPARNRAWALPGWYAAMQAQARAPDRCFILLNDCEDASEAAAFRLLHRDLGPLPLFRYEVFNTGFPGWSRGSRASGWKESEEGDPTYHSDDQANLGRVRTRFIDRALERWPDLTHVWSCDSDVYPDPDVLERLLALDRPVAGAVVRNTLSGAFGYMCCRLESGEPCRKGRVEARMLDTGTPFEVTLIGACVLIRRDVLDAGCRYGAHPNGEDFHFNAAREAAGFEAWVDPLARTRHLMNGPDAEPLR